MTEINPQPKTGLSRKAVKAISFAVIGLLMVGATFIFEGGLDPKEGQKADVFSSFDYSQSNVVEDGLVFRFNGEGNEVKASGYSYDFKKGNLWGNTVLSNRDVNIVMGKVVLMPDHAIFDLSFDGSKVGLSVYDGDVYLGFLGEGVVASGIMTPYDAAFMQTLLVPRDSSVSVSLSKITSKIEKLLYLKLAKEFKYGLISEELRGSEWVKANLDEDRRYGEKVKQEIISKILKRGESRGAGVISGLLNKAFTFIPEKREEKKTYVAFADLNNAIYSRTSLESADKSELDFNFMSGEQEVLNKYMDELVVFGSDEPQHEVYLEILRDEFAKDKIEVMDDFWRDVYKGMNLNEAKAEEAFDVYYGLLKKMYGGSGDEYEQFIVYQNQLIDNLLLRYSSFYEQKYFDVKKELEAEMLRLETDVDQKRELRQAFISNKINFLKRMVKFFFEQDFDIADTKEMLSGLIEEVNALMPAGSSNVAVTKVFEDQLDDIGDFWGYLSSSEYHTSKTYGKNHKERYESYLEDKDKVWSFINIQEDILGESKRSEVSLLDVSAEVIAVLNANEEVSDLEIGEIKDVDQRFVKVTATIGGYTFEADYDRDKGWIEDVSAFGEVVTEDAVSLDSLLELLHKKFADFDAVPGKEELPGETYAQRVARAFIAEKLGVAGFIVTIDDISVVDELGAIYRIKEVGVKDKVDLEVTFDFKMNGEIAINVYLKSDGVGFVLDGEYSLEELYKMALSGDLATSGSSVSR